MDIKKIKVDTWDIATLLYEVKSGRLRIPRFQRDFVWPKKKVLELLESIYKEFPIGSFFIWEAPKQYNNLFRKIPELEIKDPDSSDDIRYILDGQQRITSLFVIIQGLKLSGLDYSNICFDLDKSEFIHRAGDMERFIPLHKLLGTERHKIYAKLTEERKSTFDKCAQIFHKYPLSIVLVKDKGLEDVCKVFERINQGGKRLDIFDLVVAGTWDEDLNFDLKERIQKLNEKFESSFGEIDAEVVTETLSLVIHGQCTRAYQLKLKAKEIIDIWDDVVESIEKSIDFIKHNLGVKRYDFLPYRDILPLMAYFYFKAEKMSTFQKKKIEEWFWKVSFSERYSGVTFTKMGEDKVLFDSIVNSNEIDIDYPINLNIERIKSIKMGRSTAVRNAIICILALKNPQNFRNNQFVPLDRDYFYEFNKSEKHHIFPKSYLKKQGIKEEDIITNFCFIPSELNKEISNKKPSEYFKDYKKLNKDEFDTILKSHLIPNKEDSGIWSDDYYKFITQRAELIENEIKKLIGTKNKIELELEENPNHVIDKLETKIRYMIHSILYEEFGEDYWEENIPQDIQNLVRERVLDAIKKEPYQKEVYEDAFRKIEFCDIMDYSKIIIKNWNLFEDIFVSKEKVDKYFKNLKDYRNSIKHSRRLSELEKKEGEIAVQWLNKSIEAYERNPEFIDIDRENKIEQIEYKDISHFGMELGIQDIYDKLHKQIIDLGTNIIFKINKHFIGYKKGSSIYFIIIRPRKNSLWLGLRKRGKEFKKEFKINNLNQIRDIINEIKSFYE